MTLNYSEWPVEDLEEEIGCISFPGWMELEHEFGCGILVESINELGQSAMVIDVIKKCEEIEDGEEKNVKR